MVIGTHYTGDDMLTGGTHKACCTGAVCSGALGYTNSLGGTVELVGGVTSFVSFACPWGTIVAVTSTVRGANPYESSVSDIIVLGFAINMV